MDKLYLQHSSSSIGNKELSRVSSASVQLVFWVNTSWRLEGYSPAKYLRDYKSPKSLKHKTGNLYWSVEKRVSTIQVLTLNTLMQYWFSSTENHIPQIKLSVHRQGSELHKLRSCRGEFPKEKWQKLAVAEKV